MMKMLTLFVLLATPVAAFAQAAPSESEAPSKVITTVRPDVLANAQAEAPRTIGDVRVRSARVGEKTVRLVDGAIPDTRNAASRNSGS